jgi:V8-like Glu-specific endopeptidase
MSASSSIFSAAPRFFRHGAILTLATMLGASQAEAVIYPTLIPQAEMNRPAMQEAVTGVICIYDGNTISSLGSGAVVAHPKVVLTCAHISLRNGQWLPAGNLRFTARSHAQNTPTTGIFMRGYYKYDNYSSAVKARGNASNDAYNWDMIAGYAYQNFASGNAAGIWSTGADTVLKTASYTKKVTGYPYEKSKNFYQYRVNSFTGSFKQQLGAYYTITGATSYGGNSGGPVWAWDTKSRNWYAAGVFVSSDRATMMGVRALDANGVALLNAAKKAAG